MRMARGLASPLARVTLRATVALGGSGGRLPARKKEVDEDVWDAPMSRLLAIVLGRRFSEGSKGGALVVTFRSPTVLKPPDRKHGGEG